MRTSKKRKIAGREMVKMTVLVRKEIKEGIQNLGAGASDVEVIERMTEYFLRKQGRKANSRIFVDSSS